MINIMTCIRKLMRKEYGTGRGMAARLALCLFVLTFSGMFARPVPVKAEPVTIDISAGVSTTGVSVTETYTLRMTAADPSCPMPEGKVGGTFDITLKGAGKSAFTGMSFTEPGEYKYTITQLPGDHDLALSYDQSVYNLRVQVGKKDSDLQITAMMNRQGSDKKAESADFTNKYIPPAVSHNPPVKKIVTGDTPSSPAVFKFSFTAVSNTAGLAEMPMPEGSVRGKKTVSTKPGTEKEFGEMQFAAPGKYVYEIAEVKDNQKGYTYDTGVYKLTYTVEVRDRKLNCSLAVTKDGKSVNQAVFTFTNQYKGDKKSSGNGSRSSGGSSSGSSGRTAGGAQTGDETPVLLWGIVFLAAVLGIGGVLIWRRRSK